MLLGLVLTPIASNDTMAAVWHQCGRSAGSYRACGALGGSPPPPRVIVPLGSGHRPPGVRPGVRPGVATAGCASGSVLFWYSVMISFAFLSH